MSGDRLASSSPGSPSRINTSLPGGMRSALARLRFTSTPGSAAVTSAFSAWSGNTDGFETRNRRCGLELNAIVDAREGQTVHEVTLDNL